MALKEVDKGPVFDKFLLFKVRGHLEAVNIYRLALIVNDFRGI